MKLQPTESDLEARRAAVEAGRRIEAAREQGGNSAAQDMVDQIRSEQGLPALGEVVTTVQGTNGEGLTARVTTTESTIASADDEGVEFVGLSMGGEPLPDLGATETDTPTRQPYEAPELTDLGTTAPEGASFEQPTKVTGEKDGPAVVEFSPASIADSEVLASYAIGMGAFRAGVRVNEDHLHAHDVRVLWFGGAFKPYSADWSGSDAFNRAQVFAEALRRGGMTDVAVTNHPGGETAPETGAEGVQAAEEGSADITTPQALAGACGAIEVGDRFRMLDVFAGRDTYVDWKTRENGGVTMRAFFDEQQNADAFRDALLKRTDIAEVAATIPWGVDGPAVSDTMPDELKEAMGNLRGFIAKGLRKAQRRRARREFIRRTGLKLVDGFLLGLGFAGGFVVVGYLMQAAA